MERMHTRSIIPLPPVSSAFISCHVTVNPFFESSRGLRVYGADTKVREKVKRDEGVSKA